MTWKKLLKSKPFLFLLVVILVIFTYFFAREAKRQYRIAVEIHALEEEIGELETANRELSDLIAYFQTEGFQEKELRRKLNLQKPGEHTVVLPQSQVTQESNAGENLAVATNEEKNWKKWWNYFFKNK
ncbi:MAG: hypothetical protein COT91_03815 [Candidatus Doudnabacteria bacterium CG10_big_fil_rev_8_21_14_0_10_41_10]|uniref:Septum formation initiator n=1 Tax=Candidatus Doudnabacteria bacterium CG10_big_fil_rev_8_21_14_0_10_41_10 TaxID=1974551 RepID=A0A2H0VF43_9BACT|nr:MAG: hypothetical protein COT91_03815 [Candidatus Doudnabacteria bacterium CG10_big_fil_rev_8_21_14_0_10_41_10]